MWTIFDACGLFFIEQAQRIRRVRANPGELGQLHCFDCLCATQHGHATRHIDVKHAKPENDEDASVLRGCADSGQVQS